MSDYPSLQTTSNDQERYSVVIFVWSPYLRTLDRRKQFQNWIRNEKHHNALTNTTKSYVQIRVNAVRTSRQPYDAQHLEINIETSYNTQNFFNCHYLRGFNHHQENMFLLLATIQPISITDLFCYFNEARSRLQLHVHIVQREDQECWNITASIKLGETREIAGL